MRFITTIAPALLAATAQALDPVTDPWGVVFLTFVTDDGKEWPAVVGEASRGVPALSTGVDYDKRFVYDTMFKRFTEDQEEGIGYSVRTSATADSPIIFLNDDSYPKFNLTQVGEGGERFFVADHDLDKGTSGWQVSAPNDAGPTSVFYPGPGADGANAKLRLDLKEPTK